MSKPETHLTKQQLAYELLKQDILDGSLRRGMPLSERELASQYGVSRTPVRAALQRLIREGWVESDPNLGIYLPEQHLEKMFENIDILTVLEGLSCRYCGRGRTPELVAELQGNLEQTAQAIAAENFDDIYNADLEFHMSITNGAKSLQLKRILVNLANLSAKPHYIALSDLPRAKESLGEHRRIFEAIAAGDPEGAEQAMIEHNNAIRNYTANFLISKLI